MANLKTISVLGCGWLGLPLAVELIKGGYFVRGATTSLDKLEVLKAEKIVPYLVQFNPEFFSDKGEEFFESDTLILNIPPRGNPEKYKQQISKVIEFIIQHKIKKMIFISSTSVYGDTCTHVDEDTVPLPDTELGAALRHSEFMLLGLPSVESTVIRFAGLVGPGRHPGRFFVGKSGIPNGKAPVNLIHLHDSIGIIQTVLKGNYNGEIINACSPHHPSRQEFYTLAAKVSNLALPVFRDELTTWKIINSKKVENQLNYQYTVRDWTSWLTEKLF